jgi:hypothetical protein
MLFLVLLFAFSTEYGFSGGPNPFNCLDKQGEVSQERLRLVTGNLLALGGDLRKNIGLGHSQCYVARYFETSTNEGKQKFGDALEEFYHKMPEDSDLVSAYNFLVEQLTKYYQSDQ